MTFQRKLFETAAIPAEFYGGIAEGADVQTPCGTRRIERIRPGDMIVTRGQGLTPVRLVWSRRVDGGTLRGRPDTAPVRLKPRIVGPLTPKRDVVVSGDQLVLVPGHCVHGHKADRACLVAARDIAGTSDAAHVEWPGSALTLYTLVFDAPQVFSVHGLLVESFVPTPERLAILPPDTQDALLRRFPELRRDADVYPPRMHPLVEAAEYLPPQY
jgi:hypothetical protein